MQIIKSPRQFQNKIKQLRQSKIRIGFVPTMVALHEGHLSLLRKARKENDICVLSIFINPTQFAPKEDFKKYPRVINIDKKLALKENVDIIFYPTAKKM